MQTQQATKKKSPDVFAFAPYRVAEAHYLDFLIATAGALTEAGILREEASEKLSFREDDYRQLLGVFQRVKRNTSSPLATEYIRLLLENRKKTHRIVVDQFGVFRVNNEPTYQMDPLSFLILSRLLEENAVRVAKRRGIRRPYDTSGIPD